MCSGLASKRADEERAQEIGGNGGKASKKG